MAHISMIALHNCYRFVKTVSMMHTSWQLRDASNFHNFQGDSLSQLMISTSRLIIIFKLLLQKLSHQGKNVKAPTTVKQTFSAAQVNLIDSMNNVYDFS